MLRRVVKSHHHTRRIGHKRQMKRTMTTEIVIRDVDDESEQIRPKYSTQILKLCEHNITHKQTTTRTTNNSSVIIIIVIHHHHKDIERELRMRNFNKKKKKKKKTKRNETKKPLSTRFACRLWQIDGVELDASQKPAVRRAVTCARRRLMIHFCKRIFRHT